MQAQQNPPDDSFQQAIANATQAATKDDWAQAKEYLKPHEPQLRSHPQSSYLIGVMLIKEGHRDLGINWLKNAIQLNPNHAGALYAFGYQMYCMRQFAPAIECMQKVTQLIPENVLSWVYLAHSLVESSLADKAVEAYLKAVELDPKFPRMDYYLANAYLFCGERALAKSHIEKAIADDATDISVIWKYVIIYNNHIADEKLAAFEALYAKLEQENAKRSDLAYAIADVYVARKNLERACDYYEKANAIRAQDEGYDGEKRRALFAQIREQVKDWPKRDWAGYGIAQRAPIFIVGMPRSGTTLLQQMLGAHSQVTAAGELRILKQIFYDIAPQIMQKPFPELLNAMTPELSQKMGQHYLQELRKYGDTPMLIDKMPSNLFYVPMIKMILPEAVVLYQTRDPIDTCWSIWRQGFEPGHSYSYDAQRLADYYDNMLEQMRYYQNLFPDFVHEVRYETLIQEPEAEAKRLLALCGLPWEDAVLAFHEQKQKIKTASVNQASKAIYTDSKHAWEPVKHRLKPIIDALHARGIETCVSRREVTL